MARCVFMSITARILCLRADWLLTWSAGYRRPPGIIALNGPGKERYNKKKADVSGRPPDSDTAAHVFADILHSQSDHV